MGNGNNCESVKPGNCERESRGEAEKKEHSEEESEAFDSFLTAILRTPPDSLPPVPDMPEDDEKE